MSDFYTLCPVDFVHTFRNEKFRPPALFLWEAPRVSSFVVSLITYSNPFVYIVHTRRVKMAQFCVDFGMH